MAFMFVLSLVSMEAVVFGGALQNSSQIALPLKDRMDALLTATIDTSDFNNIIKEYISQVVAAEVSTVLGKTKVDIQATFDKSKEDIQATFSKSKEDIQATFNKTKKDIQVTLQEHKEMMTSHITNTSKNLISAEIKGLQASSEKNKQDIQIVIAQVEAEKKKEETRCAFLAGLKKDKENLPDGTSDIFDIVKFNKGGCYDGSSGKFTANENGLYVFSWTTVSYPGKDFTSKIVKNGNVVATNLVDSDSVSDAMTGSQTVVIEMNRGDKVWVEVVNGDGKHVYQNWTSAAPDVSVFCGFKI